jgi:uncharacterized low-complexity protein
MNRQTPAFASLFAAGAFVAASAIPAMAATPASSSRGISLLEAGCGAKKDAKDAKCGKHSKSKKDAKKKDAKDASCGKGSCGSKKG